jgi:hypothetical protein
MMIVTDNEEGTSICIVSFHSKNGLKSGRDKKVRTMQQNPLRKTNYDWERLRILVVVTHRQLATHNPQPLGTLGTNNNSQVEGAETSTHGLEYAHNPESTVQPDHSHIYYYHIYMSLHKTMCTL